MSSARRASPEIAATYINRVDSIIILRVCVEVVYLSCAQLDGITIKRAKGFDTRVDNAHELLMFIRSKCQSDGTQLEREGTKIIG